MGGQNATGGPLSSCSALSPIRGAAPTDQTTAPAAAITAPAAPAWPLFTYRRAQQRRASKVLVSQAHPDPRAATEALMGALDLFTPDSAPRQAKPRQRPAAAAAATVAREPPQAPVVPPEAVQPPTPVPAPAVVQLDGDADSAARLAQLDAVPIRLPALLDELETAGAITREARRRLMGHFRLTRGTSAERERALLGRLATQVRPVVLVRAARTAAARRLGVPLPAFTQPPSQPRPRQRDRPRPRSLARRAGVPAAPSVEPSNAQPACVETPA